MRTTKLLFIVLIGGFIFSFSPGAVRLRSPQVVFAYDGATTHTALTEETINFYGNSITSEEKEWIIEGSTEEDMSPRWLNHFYDPINLVGWTGENTGELPSEFVRSFSGIFFAPTGPVSAVRWANDDLTQLVYGRYGGDQTWKRALKYFADGDKKDAYIALGHVLHLLEDMAVPEHTRNDTHVDTLSSVTGEYGSPYEEYAMKWTRATIKNLQITENLRAESAAPPTKISIEDYLVSVAQYSNKYFFSKDTINDLKYQFPKIIRDDGNFGYGVDENDQEFPLAKVHSYVDHNNQVVTSYFIKDVEEQYPILDAYFLRLARQAVLNGAGAVALFQRQAQDAIVNKGFQFQAANEDLVGSLVSGFSFYGEWTKLKNAVGGFVAGVTSAVGDLFGKSGALAVDTIGIITGPNEINIIGVNAGQGVSVSPTVELPPIAPNLLPVIDLSPSAPQDISAQTAGQPQTRSRTELAVALGRLAESLRGGLVSNTAQMPAPTAQIVSGGGGGGNSPQPQVGSTLSTNLGQAGSPQAGGVTEILAPAAEPTSTSENSTSTSSVQATSTENSSSSSELTQENADVVLLSQPIDSAFSQGSHYSDNWYQLGGGYSGTLRKFTLRGMVNSRDYFASHVSLSEFYDPAYTTLVHAYSISDNAPFSNEITTTTFENLSIRLKPYFYYRLDTRQDYQNVSVVLAGTDSTSSPQTGTAIWNEFSYGRGRVEHQYAFTPFIIGEGTAATSTSRPSLTAPGNFTFNLDAFNRRLNFAWSSSTDPDWPENSLYYEVNYSTSTDSTSSPLASSGQATSTVLADDGWKSTGYDSLGQPNLAYGIDVIYGDVYTVGVRARDNFGAISSSTTMVWSFPSDYEHPIEQLDHSSYIGGSSQKIFIPSATVIDAIYMWGAPAGGRYCCSQSFLNIYENESGTPAVAPIATSIPVTLGSRWSDQELQYTFNEPVSLAAGTFYWITPMGGPSPTTNGTSFYGSASDTYSGGFWADWQGTDTGRDAYFRLHTVTSPQ